MRFLKGLSMLGAAAGALGAQIPFMPDAPSNQAGSTFRTLKHPSLPAHTLRVKEVDRDLCDPTVRSFSGYLDVDVDQLRAHYDQHSLQSTSISEQSFDHVPGTIESFYFWIFQSRSDPANDPHVLWLNGGPGCSSFTGLLMELGPCNAADPAKKGYKGTEWNPWSWNNNATMIFLDQPVGVGFSHVRWADPKRQGPPPSRVFSTPAAARDASAFLHLLNLHSKDIFAKSPEEANNAQPVKRFAIAGESFAGRYIPLISAQVLRDNEEAVRHPERGLPVLPLESVLIGNGITSPKHQFEAYATWTCSNVSGAGPFLDQKTCDEMFAKLPTCLRLTEKCNKGGHIEAPYNNVACSTAATFCEGSLSSKWDLTNTSIYDYAHKPDYDEEEWVSHFLNLKSTKKALGVDGDVGDKHDGTFIGCSDTVGDDFGLTGDGARESTWAVKEILEKGVRVLAYSGRRDFICNSQGNEAWTLDLDWHGKEEFNKQPLTKWYEPVAPGSEETQGRLAGEFRNYGNLTFAIVDASGHFVPHDQPAAALAMFNRWHHNPGNGRLDA